MNSPSFTSLLQGKPATVIRIGIALIFLFWAADTLIDHHIFEGGNLLEQLEEDDWRELWFRLLVTAFFVLFTWYAWIVARHRERLENDLRDAIRKAQDEQIKSTLILGAITDAMSIQDDKLVVLQQNEAHRRMSGGDHVGEFCYKAFNCSDEICPGCPVFVAMKEDRVSRIEKQGRPGSPVEFIEITASPVRNASGEIVGALEIVRDITERKWTEQALLEQNLFLQQLIDTIPSPVFYKNRDGIFLGCNRSFADCIGLQREEVIGRTLDQLIPPDLAAMYEAKERELFTIAGKQHFESFVLCAETGARRDVIFSQATYTDKQGGIAGLVSVITDITDLLRAEAEIRDLNRILTVKAEELTGVNRELEAYNYSFTHDLKNHLTRIITSGQLLDETAGTAMPADVRQLLHNILTSASEINELGEAMRLLFSVTRREIKRSDVDLSEIATSIAMNLRLSDSLRSADIDIQPGMTTVADARLIKILLENLLGNAWKYTGTKEQTVIRFFQETENGETFYVISDNGIGFASANAEGLFTPFRRLPNAASFPGSGIGLATVKRIITRHGGTIHAEGKLGEGAEFRFSLPPKAAAPQQS